MGHQPAWNCFSLVTWLSLNLPGVCFQMPRMYSGPLFDSYQVSAAHSLIFFFFLVVLKLNHKGATFLV
jgi:hypothetical protein